MFKKYNSNKVHKTEPKSHISCHKNIMIVYFQESLKTFSLSLDFDKFSKVSFPKFSEKLLKRISLYFGKWISENMIRL